MPIDLSTWLSAWYNAPFLLALLVGLGLVAVSLVGVVGDGEPDAPGWLGMGKAPLSVLVQTLLCSFGAVGLLVQAVVRDLTGGGPEAFPAAFLAALVGAVVVTRWVGLLFGRWTPDDGAARSAHVFVGMTGVTATSVSESVGQARIPSWGGATPDAQLNVRLDESCNLVFLPRDTAIIVTGYDPGRRMFTVAPSPEDR